MSSMPTPRERREARIAVDHGYGEAEHRLRSMPEALQGRKPEVSGHGRPGTA